MPIYEYTCRGCSGQFDLLVRGGELPECPQCGSRELTKELSVPAAPVASTSALPVCSTPPQGGCGRPQCGTGGCGWE
jgi:putative FmdB family regulatory protein